MHALRALQEIDRDIHSVRQELKRLPVEREKREAEIARRQAEIDVGRKRALELQVRVKEIEDQTSVQRQRIRKLEHESNSSRDVAVVEGCRYEIRTLKRQIDDAEREGIEHLEAVERNQTRTKELAQGLEGDAEVFEVFRANVEREMADASERLGGLEVQRKGRMSSELDPTALKLYERLLDARGGEALALLDSGVCQACYIEVPPNLRVRLARAREVIQCPSCDRILYAPS